MVLVRMHEAGRALKWELTAAMATGAALGHELAAEIGAVEVIRVD